MTRESVVLREIPVEFDREELLQKFHADDKSKRGGDFLEIIENAEEKVNPKALYRVSFITDREDNKITVDDVELESEVLTDQVEDVERVFPYISTCGRELDELDLEENPLYSLFLEELKGQALNAARDYLHKQIKNRYRTGNISSMNPGSGGREVWPIKDQRKLFEIFKGREDSIEVELTDSLTLVPNKSVSGIFYETERSFESCQLCPRDKCPSRGAPYNPETAEKYGLNGE